MISFISDTLYLQKSLRPEKARNCINLAAFQINQLKPPSSILKAALLQFQLIVFTLACDNLGLHQPQAVHGLYFCYQGANGTGTFFLFFY